MLRDGRSVAGGRLAGTPPEAIIDQMVGRSLTDLYPTVPHAPGRRC